MNEPSERTIKRLFALSKNRCAFPQCDTAIVQPSGTITGDVCHIKARNAAGPRYDPKQTGEERHSFDNLLLLCTVHHRIVDGHASTFTVELLREMKEIHERDGDIELSRSAAELANCLIAHCKFSITASDHAQVMVASPGSIQAQQVVIKTTKKRALAIQPTGGAIGHNLAMRNYTLHLIERFNDFQKWDNSKSGSGKFTILYRAIKKEFGCKWDFVPQPRFHELVGYVQHRILNSKLGRIRNARGEKCFSTWEEWLAENHPG